MFYSVPGNVLVVRGRGRARGRLLAAIALLTIAVSCARGDFPEVPAFDTLGFADALEPVRRQMLTVYEQWRQEPRDADRNGRLGMHLSVYGKNTAAEALYRRARTLAPGEFRWTYYLAVTLVELGRLDEAVGIFREALAIDPGYVEARIRLAAVLLQSGETAESRELYRALSDEFPERVEGWLGLGRTCARMGDNEAALAALRRARAVGPQYGEIHYALALVLRASGDEDAAAREFAAYERTVENTIPAADPLLREVSALHAGDTPHMSEAGFSLKTGQFPKAAESFRAALAINPANPEAWIGLIAAQLALGRTDAAGESYRQALAAGIAYARLHLTYGQALLDRGQSDVAREVIGRAIELDPQYAEALAAMGRLELRDGASAAAVVQFRLALSARPNDSRLRLSLAQALNGAGRFDAAAAQLEPLSTESGLDASLTLKELALAYHGMNRKDDAIDTLRRAREATRKSTGTTIREEIDALLASWQSEPAG